MLEDTSADSTTEVTASAESWSDTSRESMEIDRKSQSIVSTSKGAEREPHAPEEETSTNTEETGSNGVDSDEEPITYTRMSIPEFLECGYTNLMRWQLDRKAVEMSERLDIQFGKECFAMTDFYWPTTWNDKEDLGICSRVNDHYAEQLFEEVAFLKIKCPELIKCVPIESLPFDLRTIKYLGFIDNIFHAPRMHDAFDDDSMPWKHEQVHLLRDYFKRPIQDEGANNADTDRVFAEKDPCVHLYLERMLRLSKCDMRRNEDRKDIEQKIQSLYSVNVVSQALEAWQNTFSDYPHSNERIQRITEFAAMASEECKDWALQTENESESRLKRLPTMAVADAVGFLRVNLNGVSPEDIGLFPLEVDEEQHKKGKRTDETKDSVQDDEVEQYPLRGAHSGVNESTDTLADLASSKDEAKEDAQLALPILIAAITKPLEGIEFGEALSRVKMLLVSSLKFLETIGITEFTVYGLVIDGPLIASVAGVLRDDGLIYLFVRDTPGFKIDSPLYVWHYATLLCRIAESSRVLEEKFKAVKADLIASLLNDPDGDKMEAWTMDHQLDTLNKGKGKIPAH